MYVAVKGGEKAIASAHRLLAEERRGDLAVPELTLDQIDQQLALAVDRVMTEGSLYDRELATLAIKQARGDLIEAIFLARAYRTTLPRFGATRPIDTGSMVVRRRVSATFKDVPGGQILGATFDYTTACSTGLSRAQVNGTATRRHTTPRLSRRRTGAITLSRGASCLPSAGVCRARSTPSTATASSSRRSRTRTTGPWPI